MRWRSLVFDSALHPPHGSQRHAFIDVMSHQRSERTGLVLSFVFLFVLVPAALNAQPMRVSGRVTDQLNEPLPGVRVTEKGTLTTTTTDEDGRYELQISGPEKVLVFTATGF